MIIDISTNTLIAIFVVTRAIVSIVLILAYVYINCAEKRYRTFIECNKYTFTRFAKYEERQKKFDRFITNRGLISGIITIIKNWRRGSKQ